MAFTKRLCSKSREQYYRLRICLRQRFAIATESETKIIVGQRAVDWTKTEIITKYPTKATLNVWHEFVSGSRWSVDVARVQRSAVTLDLTQGLVKLKLTDKAQEIPAQSQNETSITAGSQQIDQQL